MRKIFSLWIIILTLLMLACSSSDTENQTSIPATTQATTQATAQATTQAIAQATTQATPQATTQATAQATTQAIAQATAQAPLSNITILNYTKFSDDSINELLKLQESKLASRKSSIIALLFPVGVLKSEGGFSGSPFNTMEVVLTSTQIDEMLRSVEQWFEKDSCMGKDSEQAYWGRQEALSEYRTWLEEGADVASMRGVCPETRVVLVAAPPEWTLSAFRYTLLHEFYHAFQQDLETEGLCRQRSEMPNKNTVWMVEGAAHYQATWVLKELQGDTSSNYIDEILLEAYNGSQENGPIIYDNATPLAGAAALRLMIQRGLLAEQAVFDASLFHSCDRELVYNSDDADMTFIRNSWHLITKTDGSYKFSSQALQ